MNGHFYHGSFKASGARLRVQQRQGIVHKESGKVLGLWREEFAFLYEFVYSFAVLSGTRFLH